MKQSNAIRDYLNANCISSERFAEMMAIELKVEKFSHRTVEKWRAGSRTPSPKNTRAIKAITGLTADQIIGAE